MISCDAESHPSDQDLNNIKHNLQSSDTPKENAVSDSKSNLESTKITPLSENLDPNTQNPLSIITTNPLTEKSPAQRMLKSEGSKADSDSVKEAESKPKKDSDHIKNPQVDTILYPLDFNRLEEAQLKYRGGDSEEELVRMFLGSTQVHSGFDGCIMSNYVGSQNFKELIYSLRRGELYIDVIGPDLKDLAALCLLSFNWPTLHPAGVQQHPPTGVQQHPPTGVQQHPPAGVQQHPPAGVQQHPPTGVQQHPPTGVQQHPPTGVQQHPPTGVQQHPPTGVQQHPPIGVQQHPPIGHSNQNAYALKVTKNDQVYNLANNSSGKRFQSGQSADLLISGFGFNDSGGPMLFNHPVSVASDGIRLVVTDRFNNRVLVWNTIPSSNVSPDIVLGQPNFVTQMGGKGLAEMDFPSQVSIGIGGKLVVADSGNDRILVWLNFPKKSGQSADFEIDVDQLVGYPGSWPWGVWTDGKKMVVAATGAGADLLFWNEFPNSKRAKPDYMISDDSVGTPRGITTNGNFFMTGDENGSNECVGMHGTKSTHIWFEWPTQGKAPDACSGNWLGGEIVGNKLITGAAGGESLYWWDELPQNSSEVLSPTLASLGQTGLGGSGHRWLGGDGVDIAYAEGKLFVVEYNGNRVSVFNSIPSGPDSKPDWAIGAESPTTNTLYENHIIQNPLPASNGKRLFVASDFDRSLSVWNSIPGESMAPPDLFYRRFEEAPWDISVWNDTVLLAGKRGVYGWKEFDGTGALPEIELVDSIGSVEFKELMGVAYNGNYFALSDRSTKLVTIWEGIPVVDSAPLYSFSVPSGPGRLDMDSEWLVIAGYPADRTNVKAVRLDQLDQGKLLDIPKWNGFPQSASITDIGFFITQQSDAKVVGWETIENAIAGESPTKFLGTGKASKSDNEFLMPNAVDWDGSHLWIGEFKFSNRLMGFSPID